MIRLRSKDTAPKESTKKQLNGTNCKNNNNANRNNNNNNNNNNNHYSSNKQNLYKRNVIVSKLGSIIVTCITLPIVILCIVLVVITLLLFTLSKQFYDNSTSIPGSIAYNQRQVVIKFCFNNNNNESINDRIFHNNNDNKDNTTHPLSSSLLFSIDDYCSKYNQKNSQQKQQRQNVQLPTTTTINEDPSGTDQSEQQQSQQEQVEEDNEMPSILIIGGTDGSGTRAIVNILRDYLGTNIIYEDPTTLDIHAPILFHRNGWPSLVNYIINYTHSGNYEYNTLPQSMKQLLQSELHKFHQYYTKYALSESYHRKQYQKDMNVTADTYKMSNRNRTLSNIKNTGSSTTTIPSSTFTKSDITIKTRQIFRHYNAIHPPSQYSTGRSTTRRKWKQPSNYKSNAIHVLYGFKAPITMMLLPLFVELYSSNSSIINESIQQQNLYYQQQQQQLQQYNSKIKFIHVVRDGRDVSLGANKSPVTKFYNTYYGQTIAQQRRTELYLKYNATTHFNDSTNGGTNSFNSSTTGSNDTFVNTVLAIDLWNDWNIQTYTYAMSHQDTVDYIVIRTEDVVSTNTSIKYSTITKLAHFVGTNQLTNNDICQYSQDTNQIKDLGVSSATYGTNKKRNGSQVATGTAFWRRKPINKKTIKNKRILESNSSSSSSNTYNLSDHQDQSLKAMNESISIRKQEVLVYAKQRKLENEIYALDADTTTTTKMNDNTDKTTVNLTSQSINNTSTATATNATGSRTTTLNATTNVSAAVVIPIHQRYGKWKSILQNQSMLSLLLHTRAQEALVLFGYEPYRTIDSDLYYSDAYTICSNIPKT